MTDKKITYELPIEALDASFFGGVLHDTVEAIQRANYETALLAQNLAIASTPQDLGQTMKSWFIVEMPRSVMLINDSPVAGILEAGSRPHTPPIEPLVGWVKRKMKKEIRDKAKELKAKATENKKSNKTKDKIPTLNEYETRIAYSIASKVRWAIKHHGTRPHGMIANNLAKIKEINTELIERELKIMTDIHNAGGSYKDERPYIQLEESENSK